MRIPMGTALLSFSDGAAPEEPVGGIVEASSDDRALIAVAHPIDARPGSSCEVRYTDPRDRRFLRVECEILSAEPGHLTVRPITEPEPANQRGSYRVTTVRTDIVATVGAFQNCPVVDVSASGLRVRVPEALVIGASIPVRVKSPQGTLEGRFEIRRVQETGEGWCVGLHADESDSALTAALGRLVNEVQRDQLRRRARVNSGQRDVMSGQEAEPEQPPPPPPGEDGWVRVPAAMLADKALPGSLRKGDGSVVASRGQVLTEEELARLGSGGLFACEDWADNAGPVEPDDRRTCARSACVGEVRVRLVQGDRIIRLRGELVDISRGGIGLRTPNLLPAGTHVVIDFSQGGHARWIMGRVVHACVGQGEVSCRVGLCFTQAAPQTGPVPDSVPAFAEWVSVKPMQIERRRRPR